MWVTKLIDSATAGSNNGEHSGKDTFIDSLLFYHQLRSIKYIKTTEIEVNGSRTKFCAKCAP